MRNPLTKEAFAEFCEAQGDREYTYIDCFNCACAQYHIYIGLPGDYMPELVDRNGSFWEQAEWAALNEPRTFTALATRLRTGEG